MKILMVIANYGVNQIDYAKQLVKEYKSWPDEVDVIINTNVALNIDGAVDNVMQLEDTMLYPKSALRTIYENKHLSLSAYKKESSLNETFQKNSELMKTAEKRFISDSDPIKI